MKILFLSSILIMIFSCNGSTSENNSKIVGKWKIYKTNSGGKDISKSSDPGNKNGLEFREDGSYHGFGNPGHQDEGLFSLRDKGKTLEMKNPDHNSSSIANIEIQQDSLRLTFDIGNKKKLNIYLYRME
jgi:hypothetical protein